MGVGVTVAGFSGTVVDVGGTRFRALKVSRRSTEYGSLGSYRKSLSATNSTAFGGGFDVYGFAYTAGVLCLLEGLTLDGFWSGPVAATGPNQTCGYSSSIRRNVTDISGTTNGTFTGNNGKLRTSMATSSGVKIAITPNASITITGTSILSSELASGNVPIPITPVCQQLFPVTNMLGTRSRLILAPTEAVIVTLNDNTSTMSQSFGFTAAWTEVTTY